MKILYISTPAYADCDFPLIKAYQELGIDITYILTIGPFNRHSTLIDIKHRENKVGVYPASDFEELQKYKDYMNLSKVYVSYRNGRNKLSPSTWIENYRLRKFILSCHFDIIHTDDYYKGIRDWIYNIGAKVVVTHHDPFPHSGENYKQADTYRHVIKNSKGTVLLNRNQLDDFCSTYNINPSKVLINRLGVYDNIKAFLPKKITRKKHNILFFGRISPYKGIEYLCEAMKIVKKTIPDATLTIAGGGKMYFDIEEYEKSGYVEVRNHYIEMSELAELLSQCDLCVCPYTDATQSGVIMTSYALGKPLIGTNVGGLPELIEEGKTGMIVPPKDIAELGDAIIGLLSNENKLQNMSSYILNEYQNGEKSWQYIAKTYIQYYQSI